MVGQPTKAQANRAKAVTLAFAEPEEAEPLKGVGRWAAWGSPLPSPASPQPRRQRRRKAITLPAVRPSVGFEVAYRRALVALADEMHADVSRQVLAAYGTGAVAQDASPAVLQAVIRRLGRRWSTRFDVASRELAEYFGTNVRQRADGRLDAILKRAGFAVPFRLTPAVREVLEATIAENVTLIRSIGAEYLTQVEGHVMRAASVGRDLGPLASSLEHQYGVTKRRAAMIARDQSNKATAVIVRERQNELGIRAIWLHSAGGKTPRPTHVAQSGKEYDPKEGWFDPDVNERIWPGTLINCRCVSRSVIPGLS